MTTIFITGASRGLGLGLTKAFAARKDAHIFAAARKPNAGDLGALVSASEGRVVPIALDVDDPASITAAAANLSSSGAKIDLLINSAGIGNIQELGKVDAGDFMAVMKTNVAGPVLVTQALRDLLSSDARVVNITSRLGSIEDADGTFGLAYPASKAALNMVSKQLSATMNSGITVLALHPGWVQTDMGGPHATLTIDQSVKGMVGVIDGLTHEHNGAFLQWDGEALPW